MHKYIFINGGYITSKERDDVIPHSHDPYQCRGVFYFDAKFLLEHQLNGRRNPGLLNGLLLSLPRPKSTITYVEAFSDTEM